MSRRRRSGPLSWELGIVRQSESWPDYLQAIGWTVALVGIMVGLAVVATVLGARA